MVCRSKTLDAPLRQSMSRPRTKSSPLWGLASSCNRSWHGMEMASHYNERIKTVHDRRNSSRVLTAINRSLRGSSKLALGRSKSSAAGTTGQPCAESPRQEWRILVVLLLHCDRPRQGQILSMSNRDHESGSDRALHWYVVRRSMVG